MPSIGTETMVAWLSSRRNDGAKTKEWCPNLLRSRRRALPAFGCSRHYRHHIKGNRWPKPVATGTMKDLCDAERFHVEDSVAITFAVPGKRYKFTNPGRLCKDRLPRSGCSGSILFATDSNMIYNRHRTQLRHFGQA